MRKKGKKIHRKLQVRFIINYLGLKIELFDAHVHNILISV